MKTKIVEYIAGEALYKLVNAKGEAVDMRSKYPDIFADTKTPGPGLDFAVLREQLDAAHKLLALLT